MNEFTYLHDMISLKDIGKWNFEIILSVQSYMSIWVTEEEEKRVLQWKDYTFFFLYELHGGYEKNNIYRGSIKTFTMLTRYSFCNERMYP
jgi:hypothetical protein